MEKKKKNDELPVPSTSNPFVLHSIWFIVFTGTVIYFCSYLGIGNGCTGTSTAGTFLTSTLACDWWDSMWTDIVLSAIVCIVIWYCTGDFPARAALWTRVLIVVYLFPGHWLILFLITHIQIHPVYRGG